MEESDPDQSAHIMTSVVKNLDVLVYGVIEDMVNGEDEWGLNQISGLAENGMSLADNEYYRNVVPEEVINQITEIQDKIVSGEIEVKSAIGMSNDDLNEVKADAER